MDARKLSSTSFGTSIRQWRTICCALDLLHDPTPVVEAAAELCRLVGASLILFHAACRSCSPFREAAWAGCDRELDYWKGRACALGVQDVTVATAQGRPGAAIIGFARQHDVDAIVIGAPAASWIARVFRRSVADRIARSAPCAVLMFRSSSAHRRAVWPVSPDSPDSSEPARRGHLHVVK